MMNAILVSLIASATFLSTLQECINWPWDRASGTSSREECQKEPAFSGVHVKYPPSKYLDSILSEKLAFVHELGFSLL